MPRSRGTKEYLPPIGGLNTSLSPRQESVEYFVDGRNIRARMNPLRLEPRKGFSVTKLLNIANAYSGTTPQTSVDISYGEWRNPNDDKEKSFIWVKSGTSVFLIDVETLAVHTEAIDLTAGLSGTSLGTAANLAKTKVEGRNVKGRLVLVGEAIDPILVSWDGTSIEYYPLVLQVRDILGLDSGIDVDKRPTDITDFPAGVTASATYPEISEYHEYNLYNQGWYKPRRITTGGVLSDPIAKFFTDTGSYPSNADISHLAVVDDGAGEILFDSSFLEDLTFGNSLAPRGHFVVDAFDIDRETLRQSPTETGYGGSGRLPPSEPIDIYDPDGENFPTPEAE